MKQGWFAVLVALVVVVTALVVVPPVSSASPGSGLSPTALQALEKAPAPLLPQLFKPVTGFLSFVGDAAPYLDLSDVQTAAIDSWYSSLTPAQKEQLKADGDAHAAPTNEVLSEFGLTPATYNYYCVGSSVVGGAVLGAAVGSLGGPVGTALGGIAGAIGGAVGAYYGCQESGNSINDLGQQYAVWAESQVSAFGNEVNLTTASYQTLASALNLSTVGWERAADHAALEQLGAPSFNISLDLYDAGIYENLAPVATAYQEEIMSAEAAQMSAMNGAGYTNTYYNPLHASLAWGNSPYTATALWTPEAGSASLTGLGAAITPGTGEVYVPGPLPSLPNGLVLYCVVQSYQCPSKITFWNEETHVWSNLSASSCSYSALQSYLETCYLGYPATSGYTYFVKAPVTCSCAVLVPGGQVAPTSATSGWSIDGVIASAPNSGGTGYNLTSIPSATYYLSYLCSGGVSPCAGSPSYVGWSQESEPPPLSFGGGNPADTALPVWITAIEWQAAQNAEAYWQFLHNAGFGSVSAVPPDCLIPEPYLVLPSSINETDLNASEWYSLYLAALEGMGHFYNVTLSGTSFCGTQAVQQWSIGSTVWGNLYINATGFVYLTNGTRPINVNGQSFPSETIGNHTTWAIGNTTYGGVHVVGAQQLLLMPTLGTVSIPVGRLYEVPANDPIQVYAVQSGVQITASGNGTSIPLGEQEGGLRPLTVQPGDAIYLTSCTVGGYEKTNCTATVQTLNITIANITCTGPCNQGTQGGGTFGGLPNPFSWLAGLFSSLFGGGPLGQLIGGITAAVVILAVILVLVYVVYRVATGKRGGSSGGQTVVVEGGRR